MSHGVFISYSHKDKPIADGICAKMEADGLRCWIAPRDIRSGEDWPTAIANGIAGSKIMVLVFSQNSNMSADISRELYLAANGKVIIIPFVIENVKPEAGKAYYLGRTHWLDAMNPPTEEQIGQLIERTHSLINPTGSAGRADRVLSPAKLLDFGQGFHRKRPWAILVALFLVVALALGAISFIPKLRATFFPVGLTTGGSIDPAFYLHREDFNDPQFDGGLPPNWSLPVDGCPNIKVMQENGTLTFQAPAKINPNCSAGLNSHYLLSQIAAVEFAISVSPEMGVDHPSFAFFLATTANDSNSIHLICGLNGAGSGCDVRKDQELVYQTKRFTDTPGKSYTFRIEVLDPDQMSFRFLANGETIGEFTVPPVDFPFYKDLPFQMMGGINNQDDNTRAGQYYLNYFAVEQR
jgi:hypothetical protein